MWRLAALLLATLAGTSLGDVFNPRSIRLSILPADQEGEGQPRRRCPSSHPCRRKGAAIEGLDTASSSRKAEP